MFFSCTFVFNMDISVNRAHTPFKFEKCILEIQIEGSVSQKFDLGHSLIV